MTKEEILDEVGGYIGESGRFVYDEIELLKAMEQYARPLLEALKEVQAMKLKPGEVGFKYAFNRCWHIVTQAIASFEGVKENKKV